MAHNYSVATVAGRFRLIALAEALSWVGLLVGMYFKRVAAAPTEIGVQVFGPVHGVIFLAFVAVAFRAGTTFGWTTRTWSLALLGSIVPLGSVIFLIWADRTAKLGPEPVEADGAQAVAPASGAA